MNTIWIDAQFSPSIAEFIVSSFGMPARSLKSLGLRDAKDKEIFSAARDADAIVMTKDADFSILLDRYGPPPKIIWITCGNTSNEHLQSILVRTLPSAFASLQEGADLVEIF